MLKILYAAENKSNSFIQLNRFLQNIDKSKYIIKIAAYKNNYQFNIDWTLNCLHNYYDKNKQYLECEYFQIYFDQIKSFNPDLIISDLEFFTSYIGNYLNIPLWQYSSSILVYGTEIIEKLNTQVYSNYSYITNRNNDHYRKYFNIINNSNLNLICSHFGDMNNPVKLKDNFEWIRPYHFIGQKSIPCQHNIIATSSNKKIINNLNKLSDCVVFSNFIDEKYHNIIVKDINNVEEYACNLQNCNLFVCEGEESYLADAFYNNKYTLVMPNLSDTECIMSSLFSEKNNLSTNIYSELDFNKINIMPIEYKLNNEIGYLHQKIESL